MPLVLLAAAPILVVLALMLIANWSATRAGLAGLVVALAVAFAGFDFGAAGGFEPLGGVLAEAAFITAGILWILWPVLALHHQQQRNGALDALREGLANLSPRPLPRALLVGWCFALFLEGAAGFGTPVALAAPLLVGLGVPPLQAVVLALLGHSAGVAFGALGTPVATTAAVTGLDADALAWRTALLNLVVVALAMTFCLRLLRSAGHAFDTAEASDGALWAVLAALAFALPATLLATGLGPELPTLGGAMLGGVVLAWALKRAPVRPSHTPVRDDAVASGGLATWRALTPYVVLVALVMATRMVPPIEETLRGFKLDWRLWDHYEGGMLPLLHPGTPLFAALLIGAMAQRDARRSLGPALAAAARRLLPVALALLTMLCLSRLMLHAGMVTALQAAAADGMGHAWPLLAPALGALGSFVTGSATASNVLFAYLQVQTAEALGLPAAWIAAGQGVGAAIGNVVCPHKVVAGAAAVGLAGREAEILRRTVLPCLVVLLLVGALLLGITSTA